MLDCRLFYTIIFTRKGVHLKRHFRLCIDYEHIVACTRLVSFPSNIAIGAFPLLLSHTFVNPQATSGSKHSIVLGIHGE